MMKKIFRMAGRIGAALAGGLRDWARALARELKKAPYRARVGAWLRLFALATGGTAVVLALLFGYFSLSLPSLDSLERLDPGHITRVTGKDGVLVHEFYIQRRIWMPEEQIPEELKRAVIAVEDRSFYRHWGVDLKAIPAALMPAFFGGRARGASTLTQQLAKNLFLTPERSIARKAREILLALDIERTYTKREILEFYFNHVYLGGGAYGFVAASQRYFNKPLDSLATDQYAMLAGLLQRPELYRPDVNPELARQRRNVVLAAMRRDGVITRDEMQELQEKPLDVSPWRSPTNLGPYFTEHVRQFLSRRWGDEFVYTHGGVVEVTMDSALQAAADTLLRIRLGELRRRMQQRTADAFAMPRRLGIPREEVLQDFDRHYARFEREFILKDTARARELFPVEFRYRAPQAALIVLDNATGAVRAMVGGENFETTKYNRAVQAVRSPGSAFKPFVYAAAIERGASPGDIVTDQPITIPEVTDTSKIWTPSNFDGTFEGRMTMRRALYRSQNLPAVEVALATGLDNVVALARRAGFRQRVLPVPSLALGSLDATVLEVASAYTVFPNGGFRAEPHFVRRVLDREGRELYRHEPRRDEVLSPEAAWIVTSMLRDVVIRGTGAAVWASGFRIPAGGKTGTTNDHTDAWFVGFTREHTAAVWVGRDDFSPMGPGNTGAANGVPLWVDVMRVAERNGPVRDFPRPEGVATVLLCPVTGLKAQGFCPAPQEDFVIAGHDDKDWCSPGYHTHQAAPVDAPVVDDPAAPARPGGRIKRTF